MWSLIGLGKLGTFDCGVFLKHMELFQGTPFPWYKRPYADDDFEEDVLDDLKKSALKKLKQSKKN